MNSPFNHISDNNGFFLLPGMKGIKSSSLASHIKNTSTPTINKNNLGNSVN